MWKWVVTCRWNVVMHRCAAQHSSAQCNYGGFGVVCCVANVCMYIWSKVVRWGRKGWGLRNGGWLINCYGLMDDWVFFFFVVVGKKDLFWHAACSLLTFVFEEKLKRKRLIMRNNSNDLIWMDVLKLLMGSVILQIYKFKFVHMNDILSQVPNAIHE